MQTRKPKPHKKNSPNVFKNILTPTMKVKHLLFAIGSWSI